MLVNVWEPACFGRDPTHTAGFNLTPLESRRLFQFKPASVRSLWSAVQVLMKLLETAQTLPAGPWQWLDAYRALIADPAKAVSPSYVLLPFLPCRSPSLLQTHVLLTNLFVGSNNAFRMRRWSRTRSCSAGQWSFPKRSLSSTSSAASWSSRQKSKARRDERERERERERTRAREKESV
jgi:hypothetical protein